MGEAHAGDRPLLCRQKLSIQGVGFSLYLVSLDKSTFEKWICPQNMQVLLVVMNLKRMLIPFLLEKKKRTPKLVSNF